MKTLRAMNKVKIQLLFSFIILATSAAEARVFSFKDETMAAFFHGTYGLSRLGSTPYKDASGVNTEFAGPEHKANFSGELGFLYTMSPRLTLRLGAEVIQAHQSEIVGQAANETKYFDLVSDVFVFSPNATFEWHIDTADWYRLSFFVGAGYATVTSDLNYTFTTAGKAALGVSADYDEAGAARLISGHTGFIFEMAMIDTVTTVLELGFRHMPIPKLTYADNVTTITGAQAKGDTILDQDGSNRTLDMSGYYLGLSFRFFISIL